MSSKKTLLLVLLFFSLLRLNSSSDTIGATGSIRDGDNLVSSGATFALGFFSPGVSVQRFVGIRYNRGPGQTIVWVANRENPLNDTSGILSIDLQGNLVLSSHNGRGNSPVWSTNVSSPISRRCNPLVQLLDSGNLVLYQDVYKKVIRWQSFDYPTDTHLPNMKIGLNRTSGFSWSLTSWRSDDNPQPGDCMYAIDPTGYPQLFMYMNGRRHWRVGPWTGLRFSGLLEIANKFMFSLIFVNDHSEVSIMYSENNESMTSAFVLKESGTFQQIIWIDQDQRWETIWSAPTGTCDYYNQCGPNGKCDPYMAGQHICSCLPGFEPKSPGDWYTGDTTAGCIRRIGASICQSGEGFVKVGNLKVPDTSVANVSMSLSLIGCKQVCLSDCSCTAYASANESGGGSGCLTWHGDLLDTRTFPNTGQEVYVRVDATDLAHYSEIGHGNKKILAILLVSAALVLLLFFFSVLIIKRRKGRRRPTTTMNPLSFDNSRQMKELERSSKADAGLPLFELSLIAAATDNFSISNRLGQGGFGTVYKGVMSDGTEIAVKRLSEYSRQGNEEFKNEVNLIARLQHRNLVKTLGFCLQDNEKMLVYEYLPNKSLDTFLFNESKKSLLDWRKRLDIATGVARGLMYLHQDSRLRIIHRDLKASNVLLDSTMNPKISDFGMARMCGGDQIEGNTKRVVGTYGYMAPEYAMEGLFSIKSDVYSFGILLFEIVSGKKNSTYYHQDSSSNLIGHIWELWKEGRCMDIVDESMEIEDPHSTKEVLKCLQIGLLCVQELAVDRPTMSMVVFMLGNDSILPSPKQPAYIIKRYYVRTDNSTNGGVGSLNEVTVSMLEGR